MFQQLRHRLCRRWHRFRALQRRGVHTQHSPLSFGAQPRVKCLSCGQEYTGNYCPVCGQSAGVKRLTIAVVLRQVASSLTNLESGFLRTCLELFYRPGYLIRDYLTGRRSCYQNPFSLLFVLATLHVLMHYLFYHSASVTFQMDYESHPAENPEVLPLLEMFHRVISYLTSNQALVTLAYILFYILPNKLVFRLTSYGRGFNLAEHFYVMLFVGCQMLITSIVIMPIDYLLDARETAFTFDSRYDFLFMIWDFRQLFRISYLRSAWYYLLSSLLASLLFLIVVFVVAFIGFYYYNVIS